MSKRNSISINAVLYVIRNIMKIIFPLITFPYISRVLGVNNIGNLNFATSINNYFVLIAGLGIVTYAVREGARVRHDKQKLQALVNEVFSINILSTIIAYTLLMLAIFSSDKLRENAVVIIILSIQIVFNTLGVEWIYTIEEDFLYITVRSIVMQFVSLILMFAFVKDASDLHIYASIVVVASVGSNLFNWIRVRKYCVVRFVKNMNFKRHIKPIMYIFATTISISIYSTSDMTLLGFLSGPEATAYYAVSAKVYDIAKSTLAAIILVSIPRLSAMLGRGEWKQYETKAAQIYRSLISIACPVMIGMMLLAEDVILVISGKGFLASASSMRILCMAAIINLGAWFWGQCVLIPIKQERTMLIMSIFTAILNVVLNIFMIPFWHENAAAMTTLISELVSLGIVSNCARRTVKLNGIGRCYVKTLLGCLMMTLGVVFVLQYELAMYLEIILSVAVGGVLYFGTELIVKNKDLSDMIFALMRRVTGQLSAGMRGN